MGVFDGLLRQHEAERHGRILAEAWRARRRPTDSGSDGFLAPAEAARVMGVSAQTLALMVGRHQLEQDDRGRVRPAVVSILAVRDSAA